MFGMDPLLLSLLALAAIGGVALLGGDADHDADESEQPSPPDQTAPQDPASPVEPDDIVSFSREQISYDLLQEESALVERSLLVTANDLNNMIRTGSGDDTISAGGSDEAEFGSEFEGDVITLTDDDGELYADIVISGAGNDTLFGDSGSDILLAGPGNDTAFGGSGADILSDQTLALPGEEPEDRQTALSKSRASDNDMLDSGSGDDLVFGLWGSDTVYGGRGDDVLSTRDEGVDQGADRVYGGAGDDILIVDNGDHATGDSGSDVFRIDGTTNQTPDVDEMLVTIHDFEVGQGGDELVIVHSGENGPAQLVTLDVEEGVQIGLQFGDQTNFMDSKIDQDFVLLLDVEQAGIDALISENRIRIELG